MRELTVEADAAEVGLDSERLKRVDAFFAGYVADGRLPGWLDTIKTMNPNGPGCVPWP